MFEARFVHRWISYLVPLSRIYFAHSLRRKVTPFGDIWGQGLNFPRCVYDPQWMYQYVLDSRVELLLAYYCIVIDTIFEMNEILINFEEVFLIYDITFLFFFFFNWNMNITNTWRRWFSKLQNNFFFFQKGKISIFQIRMKFIKYEYLYKIFCGIHILVSRRLKLIAPHRDVRLYTSTHKLLEIRDKFLKFTSLNSSERKLIESFHRLVWNDKKILDGRRELPDVGRSKQNGSWGCFLECNFFLYIRV